MENIEIFLSENVQILEAKFSIYWCSRGFVMWNVQQYRSGCRGGGGGGGLN